MGMYDNFTVDYPLPVESWIPDKYKNHIYYSIQADGFQSKSLNCILNNYYIDNNGYIYLDNISLFEEPEKRIDRKKIYFHGHISIYNSIFPEDDKKIIWLEYDLKFTDGLLVSATMLSPRKEHFDTLK